MNTILIIGAGPAGLSAAYEISNHSDDYNIIILEKEDKVGGLAKTFTFNGNRVDVGGHRFFTKSERVSDVWNDLFRDNKEEFLKVKRRSHILYQNTMVEYPIKISRDTVRSLGWLEIIKVLISYLSSKLHGIKTANLEDYYISHFGKELYNLFFREYTRKLWGIPAKELSSDWGAQRVQGLSIRSVISYAFKARGRGDLQRTLADTFYYPVYGSGQIWETMARQIVQSGKCEIKFCCEAKTIEIGPSGKKVRFIQDGELQSIDADILISSMPLREFTLALQPCPNNIQYIARNLSYRDMIIVALSISDMDEQCLLVKNKDDCWVYVQSADVKIGRIQVLNNWSLKSVSREKNFLIEIEYYCTQDDDFWRQNDQYLVDNAWNELRWIGYISSTATCNETYIQRIANAYPIYSGGYYELNLLRDWVNALDGVFCVGRNGQHHYNNMDHSMMTAFCAADVILGKHINKETVWDVNTDSIYHER